MKIKIPSLWKFDRREKLLQTSPDPDTSKPKEENVA